MTWVGIDPKDHQLQPPRQGGLWQEHLPLDWVAQRPGQGDLEHFHKGDMQNFSGQHRQCPKSPSHFSVSAHCFSSCHWTPLKRVWLLFLYNLSWDIHTHWWDSSWAFSSLRCTVPGVFSFSPKERCSSPLFIFMSLFWILSSINSIDHCSELVV